MDCSQPGSSVLGISQARILEWVAIFFFRGSPNASVQFSSVAQSCLTLCDPMDCSMTGLPVNHQLPEFIQTHDIKLVTPSSHLIRCRPLLLSPIPPSIRVFPNESTLHMKWPKYWSFSFMFQTVENT